MNGYVSEVEARKHSHGEHKERVDEQFNFGFIARGSLDDFVDIREYIEDIARLIYQTKSTSNLWIVKGDRGGEHK